MSKVDLIDLQNRLKSQDVLISFSGRFSQVIIEELSFAIRKYMESEEQSKSDVFNVLSIFIEQSQNIKNYIFSKEGSDCFDEIVNSSVIVIGKEEKGYFICSVNLIFNFDQDRLTEKLERIKNLNKDELKKLYKEQIKKNLDIDSQGAGIGLIDMARKSSLPIEYSITKLDDKRSYFTLSVTV